jgi:hypothetical protein
MFLMVVASDFVECIFKNIKSHYVFLFVCITTTEFNYEVSEEFFILINL